MLLAPTGLLVFTVDLQISSPHDRFTHWQTEALSMSQLTDSSRFPRTLPVLALEVLDPRNPVCLGQTGTLGHLKGKRLV